MADELNWAQAGRFVAQERGRLGLTQEQFADTLDIGIEAFRQFERGQVDRPRRTTTGAIERGFGWHPGTLESVARGEDPPVSAQVELRLSRLEEAVAEIRHLVRGDSASSAPAPPGEVP